MPLERPPARAGRSIMASYSLEEFVGNGALKEIVGSLMSDGWDDVPTLKMMSAEDMEALNLTQQQRDALEIRSYLHDRSLMEYADKLEASGKNLAELLNEPPTVLTSRYGMKRGHVARFIDRASACGIKMPPTLSLPVSRRTRRTASSLNDSSDYSASIASSVSTKRPPPPSPPAERHHQPSSISAAAPPGREDRGEAKPAATKGIVAAAPENPRLCGLIPAPRVADDVTPLEVLERISVQRVTPELKKGIDPWAVAGEIGLPPPMKTTELWTSRPALLFIIRRPGCVMCRAEAHQLYARKPIFDAMGIQLIAVIGEFIDAEVRAFWPRYWGGMVVVDKSRDFFRALGGGNLLRDNLVTGFCFNPSAITNYKRAKKSGVEGNLVGEGLIKGGLYIMRPGKGGVAYQFVERNFGDWAPLEEVLSVCSNLQKPSMTERSDSYMG